MGCGRMTFAIRKTCCGLHEKQSFLDPLCRLSSLDPSRHIDFLIAKLNPSVVGFQKSNLYSRCNEAVHVDCLCEQGAAKGPPNTFPSNKEDYS